MIAIKQLQKHRYDNHNNIIGNTTRPNKTRSLTNNKNSNRTSINTNRIITNVINQVESQQLREEVRVFGMISMIVLCPT